MRAFFRNKDTGIRFLDNDTLKIIKNRLFSTDMFYYPAFIKIFFVKENKKIYIKHQNETILDSDYIGDVYVEFIGDSFTQEELTIFRIDPEGIVNNVMKEWGDVASEEEIKFIISKIIDTKYSNSSVESHIKSSYKKSVDFIKKYDNDLKNIPKPHDNSLIENIKINNIQYELSLKTPAEFNSYIKNKFVIGASEEIPFIILKTSKGSKVKTVDLSLKSNISKKDLIERDMILFMVRNDKSKYIFTPTNNKLFVHTDNPSFKPNDIIKDFVKDFQLIDVRYSAQINRVFNVKKIPQTIKENYETFFKNKEFVRKGNSILLDYIRTKDGDIKISIKESKNGAGMVLSIYNINSKYHLDYVISIVESLLLKSSKSKVQQNFFEEKEQDIEQKQIKNIKKLKSGGISSVVCQKQRQPEINNERNKNALKYELVHKENRYLCNNSPYLFPGFTVDENVCCFKKDQRKKDIYNRLTGNNINKIKVRASNLVVNGKRVLKDEYENYFYIKKYDPLEIEKISSSTEINKIKSSGDVWLKESLLGKVLYTNSKDCKKSPKMIDGEYICKNVGPIKYHFGYTESSVPCCFKEPRPTIVKKELGNLKDSENYYDGKYIITTDKSIDKGRLGVLPSEIYYMFTLKEVNVKSPEKNEYFRLGSKRNLTDVIKNMSSDFDISSLLSKELFKLSRKNDFKSYEEYKKYIENKETFNIKNVIDYVSLLLKTNIILFDFQSDDIEKCVNFYGKNKKNIILIKNEGYYEYVCKLQNDNIIKFFNNDEIIIKNIKKYLKFKCNMSGSNVKISLKDLLKLLKKDNIKIKNQVISNESLKVLFIETEEGIYLPVFPSRGIKRNIPQVYTEDVDLTINQSKFEIFLNKYSKYYSKIDFINNGVLLNDYLILPTKGTYNETTVNNVSYINGMFNKTINNDKRLKFIEKMEKQSDYYYSLKYKFSQEITVELKEKIREILSKDVKREEKFREIRKLVEKYSSFTGNESYYITQQLLGVDSKEILDKLLPLRKVKMVKINFENYRQLLNWIKL